MGRSRPRRRHHPVPPGPAVIDPTVLADDGDGDGGAGVGGGGRELAVVLLKSTASSAILTLPPFAVHALRRHRRHQHRLRLALGHAPTLGPRWVEPGQPPHPVEPDLVFRTERGTPINPNHASRAFARLAARVGLAAHPHLLRHALASAMAANKEPASIIAAQLRHADGGALAQRVDIHQLPQTAPRLAGVIERVFGPEAHAGRCRLGVGRRESRGNVGPQARPEQETYDRVVAAQGLCGRDRIRTCVGNAGDFTGRSGGSPQVPSHHLMVPIPPATCTNSLPTASAVT
jgi:Phage integrase family